MSRTPYAGTDAGQATHLGLPVELLPSLDDAFASEVAVRLPRMFAATARLRAGATDAAHSILSDVHALASSANVVGEDVAAYAARECEQLLLAFVHGSAPYNAVQLISGGVDALGLALARWADPTLVARQFPVVPPQVAGRG